MNEMSVGSASLPGMRRAAAGERIAREAVFRALGCLQTGSLTLHEGQDTFHFGGDAGEGAGPRAQVHVHDPAAYGQVLKGGAIAAGESYMRGLWSSPDLVQATRLFCANLSVLEGFDAKQSLGVRIALRMAHLFNRNTRSGSKNNIAAHDLGNDFFRLFLDESMMYSSALFTDPRTTLEYASEAKLDELCVQLELGPEDHLLEIGTGWGGMAIHAARYYGCRVTTTTISREQFEYASRRVREEGLEDRITLLCEDYRNLSGRYDKLVSIEMIEAVGHEFYSEYFRTCSGLLRDDGVMVIQAITMADQRYDRARGTVDFIKRYIFPGGCLPSIAVIAAHLARDTDMQMVHLRDISRDYAMTLAHWRDRFMARLDAVRAMGFSEEFIRMWEYYLCYCEGGFRERVIGTVQVAFAKPAYRRA